MVQYDSFDVACYIVNSCIDNGTPISNLKLQKILYYAQAAFLVKDERLFDDKISAWRYGPVIEDVYYYFRKNVNKPITERIPESEYCKLKESDRGIVDAVIRAKNKYDAFNLVKHTHSEYPWINAVKRGWRYISEIDIKNYFIEHPKEIYS